ncbi:mitochondrial dimethyladenosine transferase 1-like [Convolutriloba macropyga]|uniref:mitochondrial dimethyladenosine transferase 1-like n=1 Tax=Convolutriloba macropyga TaxID=536237 RepID=UPI003F524446
MAASSMRSFAVYCRFCRVTRHPTALNMCRTVYFNHDDATSIHNFEGREVKRMKFPPLPSIQDLLRIYRLKSVRLLSQTFLIREDIARRIARSLGSLRNATVYEIGPGPGIITREILKQFPERLIAIEKDFRFRPIITMLKTAAEELNCDLQLITEDCLKHDFTESSRIFGNEKDWNDESPNLFIMGNLPFNVSLPFLVKLLHDMDNKTGLFQHGRVKMVFTFQKEICEQIVAREGDDKRGRLSLMAQSICHVDYVMTIANKVFVPRPECDTGLVIFEPKKSKLINVPLPYFEKLVKAVMHYKNKQCFRGLMDLFPKEVAKFWAIKLCTEADVPQDLYPRFLDLKSVSGLADVYFRLCTKYENLFEYDYQRPKLNIPNQLLADTKTHEEDCSWELDSRTSETVLNS